MQIEKSEAIAAEWLEANKNSNFAKNLRAHIGIKLGDLIDELVGDVIYHDSTTEKELFDDEGEWAGTIAHAIVAEILAEETGVPHSTKVSIDQLAAPTLSDEEIADFEGGE
jgi:hypothetical protein